MTRGVGVVQFAAGLPEVVVAFAGLVTQLGDMWFVLVAICAIYIGSRMGLSVTDDPWKDCLFLLALAVGSYSLTVVLKHIFTLPRPPGASTAIIPPWIPDFARPVYESMVTGHGYGFPSGHALKTTVVYGAAASTLTVWTRNRRLTVAGLIIVAVSLSRVILGVHYLADVVGGIVFGAAFLVLVRRTADGHPGYTLAVAAVLGVGAFALSFGFKSALAAVVALLGLGAWMATERSPRAAALVGSTPSSHSEEEL